MLVANYFSNKDIRLAEVEIPAISENEVLVEVIASGICGSDLMQWYKKDNLPKVLGHETSGKIIKVGSKVLDHKIGDRVVVSHHVPCMKCRFCKRKLETMCKTLKSTDYDPGGFSEYLRMPELNTKHGIFRIPNEMTYEEASFAEPLACVLRGQKKIGVSLKDSVVVIGAGISGMLHIALAKALGASFIVAVDLNKTRLGLAENFGADKVSTDSQEIADILLKNIGRKANHIILTTGNTKAVSAALESIEDGGNILLFAPSEPGDDLTLDLTKTFFKHDLTITSTYANSPQDLMDSLEIIGSGKIQVKKMITHRLPLKDIQKGFDLVNSGENSLKVIIEPHSK